MNEGMNVSVALLVGEVHVILLQTCEPFIILQLFFVPNIQKSKLMMAYR